LAKCTRKLFFQKSEVVKIEAGSAVAALVSRVIATLFVVSLTSHRKIVIADNYVATDW
jgi:hypothetical protein